MKIIKPLFVADRPAKKLIKPLQIWPLAFLLALLSIPVLAAENCQNLMPDKSELIWVDAEFAITGDTIIVQNQKTRLIGLNAPKKEEKEKFNTSGEPLAEESQTYLNKLLANHNLKIGILYDQTQTDEFNRQLVHAFFEDGKSVQIEMLKAGFAIYRPELDNNRFANCYIDAEQSARNGGYQLWDLLEKQPDLNYPLIESSEIYAEDEGYRIIRGEIVLSQQGKKYFFLKDYYQMNMDTLGIRIPVKSQSKFDTTKLKALKGQQIEVRGLVYHYKGAMYMVIHSPLAINVLAQDVLQQSQ